MPFLINIVSFPSGILFMASFTDVKSPVPSLATVIIFKLLFLKTISITVRNIR